MRFRGLSSRVQKLSLSQGGIITHEYSLIKGFAAKASETALDIVQTLGEQHDVVIEADQTVSINDA